MNEPVEFEADLYLKTFSTYPPLMGVLLNDKGPVDLTDAVEITVTLKGSQGGMITGVCTVDDTPTDGIATYQWATEDTEIADRYQVEFQVNWGLNDAEEPLLEVFPDAKRRNPIVQIDDSLNEAAG